MNKLKDIRKIRNLSQSEVAEALQIPQTTYSRYERGETRLDSEMLIRLSEYYDVSTDYLLGLIEVPFSSEEVRFMKEIYKEKDLNRIAEEFEVYGEDPEKPVTVKDLKQIIDKLKELDREVHGNYFKNKKDPQD